MNMMDLKETNMVIYGGFRKATLAIMMQQGWGSSGNRSRCFQGWFLPLSACPELTQPPSVCGREELLCDLYWCGSNPQSHAQTCQLGVRA